VILRKTVKKRILAQKGLKMTLCTACGGIVCFSVTHQFFRRRIRAGSPVFDIRTHF
jgi:hypothetical protein